MNPLLTVDNKTLNETVNLVITQSLITNLTRDFLAPKLANITNLHLGNKTDGNLTLDDKYSVGYNITQAHVDKVNLNGSVPLLLFGDQNLTLQLNELDL